MAAMADHPVTPEPAVGVSPSAAAQAGAAGRPAAWRTGLAVLALAAVVGGLVAGVRSAANEPSPPDLGGPILARGAAPVVTPAPARTSQPAPPMTAAPSAVPRPPGLISDARASAAAEVGIRPVPLPVAATPASELASPAPRALPTVPPSVSPTP